MLANPIDQVPQLDIRLVAVLLRDFLHLVKQRLLLAAQIIGVGRLRRTRLTRSGDRLHLRDLRRLRLGIRPETTLIVGIGRVGKRDRGSIRRSGRRILLRPRTGDRCAMHLQTAGKRLDRREQALLKPDRQQTGSGLDAAWRIGEPLIPQGAVLIEQL